jgi:hypothetical protein
VSKAGIIGFVSSLQRPSSRLLVSSRPMKIEVEHGQNGQQEEQRASRDVFPVGLAFAGDDATPGRSRGEGRDAAGDGGVAGWRGGGWEVEAGGGPGPSMRRAGVHAGLAWFRLIYND